MNPNKKKKILFVITKSNWGGAQRYVYDLATAFDKRSYQVKVAMGGHGILFNKLKDAGVETIAIPGMERDITLKGDLRAGIALWRIFKTEKPDIVHLNSSKAGLGSLAATLSGVKKIIFTMHGLALNEDRPRYQKFILRIFYWLTIFFSNKTVAVSNALKKQSAMLFPFLSKKVILVHNGLLVPDFLSRENARNILIKSVPGGISKIDLPIAALVFGTIGELHPIKGHKYLLEGFKEALDNSVVPLFLFIIGEGEEREKRQKQIETLKLSKNVFLCGHIDDAVKLLKAFDIFIFTSLSEGLPYAVTEAGMAELATICTNVGGIPEIIIDKEQQTLKKKDSQ